MNCMISVVRRMLLNIRFTFSDIDLMDKKYWLVINVYHIQKFVGQELWTN